MSSVYTGDPANGVVLSVAMLDDGDEPAAQLWRTPEELLLDNDAAHIAAKELAETRTGALRFRVLDLIGSTLDDTSDFMAATALLNRPAKGVVLCKAGANDVYNVYPDEPRGRLAGDIASVTSDIRDAASNGARIVVIGTGGQLNSYSDNEGASWSAGSAGIGNAVEYLVWSPANSLSGGGALFFTGGVAGGAVYKTTTPTVAWTSVTCGFAGVLGLAVLGGTTSNKGYVVALGSSGGKPRFSVLTDGGAGASFTGTQQPPNASSADEPGSIAGAPSVTGVGSYVYHVMRSGNFLRLARTSDGFTWSAGPTATLSVPPSTGTSFSGTPRLMICQTTGLMVIAAPIDVPSAAVALYASRDFENWTDPAIVNAADVSAFSVAGGRVFYTQDDQIMASDGIGGF